MIPEPVRRRLPFLHIERHADVVTCPVCGATGSPSHPHPYKTWALAGTTDAGRPLRRCQRCGAEIGIDRPWQWWLPRTVWLHSRVPEPGKARRRKRERRASSRVRD